MALNTVAEKIIEIFCLRYVALHLHDMLLKTYRYKPSELGLDNANIIFISGFQ